MAKPERTRLSALQFLAAINHDPDWLKNTPGEIEVYEPVTMSGIKGKIDKNVFFTGVDTHGRSVMMEHGKLEEFRGTLSGGLRAVGAKLKSTAGLVILGVDYEGISANFADCKGLTVAEGTYKGGAIYTESGIRKIGDLKVECAVLFGQMKGLKADFSKCPLTRLPQRFDPAQFRVPKEVAAAYRLAASPDFSM